MIKVDFQAGPFIRSLDAASRKHLPFATALALTRTAEIAGKDAAREMARVFDRPTSYTLKSVRIVPATKARLWADVKLKDDQNKGTPAAKYLAPEIQGGARRHKRAELALIRKGLMKPDQFAVPLPAAGLDAYGNLSGAKWVRILSSLKAFGEQGYTANQTARSKRRNKGALSSLWVANSRMRLSRGGTGKGGANIPPGIYSTQGGKLTLLVLFVSAPNYRKRLGFYEVVRDAYVKHFQEQFGKAFREALASAKG